MAVESKRARNSWPAESSLEELALLCRTAGAEVAGRMIQKLVHPSSQHYLGQGKLEELQALRSEANYSMVAFDDELSPWQQRHLEDFLQVKVIDRTALILDIFARRARTREGSLQVELAQHQYLLPRLAGQWSHLERLGGGIGTRGPGESQLETDRRLIREKIHRLKREIEGIRRHRRLYRQHRQKQGLPVVAVVGYTNAGKSTLFNALCQAQVFVEDKLFATLDPTTRRLRLPGGKNILLSDTVGFIQKLPPTLVTAFRATLEELEEAGLILHVLDITHRNSRQQRQTVEQVLRELGLDRKPLLLALNKVDLLSPGEKGGLGREGIEVRMKDTAYISALQGWGLDRLLELIEEKVKEGAALGEKNFAQ